MTSSTGSLLLLLRAIFQQGCPRDRRRFGGDGECCVVHSLRAAVLELTRPLMVVFQVPATVVQEEKKPKKKP